MRRLCSLVLIAALCIVAATGCSRTAEIAPVTMVAEQGTNAAGKMLTAHLLTWDVQRGTLTLSDKPLFARSYYNDWPAALWSPGPPFAALQRSVDQTQGGIKKDLLMLQSLSPDVKILELPDSIGAGYVYAQGNVSWYAWDKQIFMSAPQGVGLLHKPLNARSVQITQYTGPVKTLAAVLPSELDSVQAVYTIYGSGSLDDGFVLVETGTAGATTDVFWLIRLSGGKATWLLCGDAPCGGVTSGAGPQFVRIGSRLYLIGGCRTKIAMIDTAAVAPTLVYPRGLNTTFMSLFQKTWKDSSGLPFHAQLHASGTVLELGLFDTASNTQRTYALNEDGTILGYLETDTSGQLWCMNASGQKLSSLSLPDCQHLSSPSQDLFSGW
jgi:hypothetical protein